MDQKNGQPQHQPFLWEAKGSDTAVLLVHGVLGSPNQFDTIAHRLLDAGCTVMAILLPGHGDSAEDFAKAKTQDWQRAVHEAAVSLREHYLHIFLLGHSMGGLLAIGEAIDGGADGLILLSTPMRLKTGFRAADMSARVLRGSSDQDDERIKSYRRAFSVEAGSLWQRVRWLAPFFALFRLMSRTRRKLDGVSQPVLIIQSKRDETVAWRSADIFKRELKNACDVEVLMLSHSEHSYHHPDETEALYARIVGFITGRRK